MKKFSLASFCFLFLFIGDVKLSKLDLSTAEWTLTNENGSISVQGSVPGGVYSDLYRAGVIGDILYGFNDVLTRWVAHDTWTYSASFNVTSEDLATEVAHLVLEGVDTVAYVELNDSPVISVNNMFVRYVVDVKQQLQVGENKLKLIFVSPVEAARLRSEKHFTAPACVPDEYNGECHANQLRKMQASFSWDWGPAFPSVGLWKPAYIEFYNGAIIRVVTTHFEKKNKDWNLTIRAHLESPRGHNGDVKGYLSASLNVEGNQKFVVGGDVELKPKDDGTSEADLRMFISENVVREWWPNGFGEQPLYDLDVYLSNPNDVEISHKHLKIAFRIIEVVEENASLRLGNTTNAEGLTFYFKVNGYPIFMKGSNWIPSHILPELGADVKTVDNLLEAARDTHMSMLRVWGGGVYESEYFYEKCDELGILVWQDFMFACAMYPVDPEFIDNVKTEIEQTVINLQHHPSIALWSGNNENEAALRGNWYTTSAEFEQYKTEYIKLYVDTIKPIVEDLDPGRRYLVSSPSNGLESEEEGYIAKNPYDSHYGDTHYYNYIVDNWDFNVYPATRFASEYGVQALPSIATMKTATKDDKDFSVDSDYSKHRQHHPNGYTYIENQIEKRMNLKDGPKHFEDFVFYSQISQAMSVKAQTEFYRQSQADWYTMGALYWQLNDVWQAPSWSSIEYGGRWKMLHYFTKTFFSPVLVSPRLLTAGDVDVYLLNDRFVPIADAQIIVDYFNWTSLIPFKRTAYKAEAPALSSKKQDFQINLWDEVNTHEVFLRFSLKAEGVTSSPYNYVFPKPLNEIKGLRKPKIQITISRCPFGQTPGKFEYFVDIRVDSIVLFLWLETPRTSGYFEDNGLVLTQPYFRTKYISKENIKIRDLQKSITYKYYNN